MTKPTPPRKKQYFNKYNFLPTWSIEVVFVLIGFHPLARVKTP